MDIGSNAGTTEHIHGWVALVYWPRTLSAAELLNLSNLTVAA
jgi:hypothetical protein